MAFMSISILQAAAACGIQYGRNTAGAEVRAKCPFCKDSQPRLYMNTEKNVFHCQRCKKSGNSITLYAERNGVSNAAAGLAVPVGVQHQRALLGLQGEAGVAIPGQFHKTSPFSKSKDTPL